MPRQRRFHPHLEHLEKRLCLSCTATPRAEAESTGILRITGDAAVNAVSITVDHDASDITVKCDGNQTNYDPALIDKIVVKLKGGDDDFIYRLGGGSDFEDAMTVVAKFGSGSDSATINLYNTGDDNNDPATIKANLSLNLRGGDGVDRVNGVFGVVDSASLVVTGDLGPADDFLNFNLNDDLLGTASFAVNLLGGDGNDIMAIQAAGDVNIDAGATLSIALGGNMHDDELYASYQGILNGNLNIVLAGDRNDDTLTLDLTLDAGSDGTLDAAALGEKNNDTLTFSLVDNSGSAATLAQALLDGGPGADACTSTPNVTEVNCET